MRLSGTTLVLACSLLGSPACSDVAESFPDSALTADEWQTRGTDARRRSEEFIAGLRAGTIPLPSAEQDDREEADQRAMRDPSLQQGDIISTSKGLLIFNGIDREERTPADFSPASGR